VTAVKFSVFLKANFFLFCFIFLSENAFAQEQTKPFWRLRGDWGALSSSATANFLFFSGKLKANTSTFSFGFVRLNRGGSPNVGFGYARSNFRLAGEAISGFNDALTKIDAKAAIHGLLITKYLTPLRFGHFGFGVAAGFGIGNLSLTYKIITEAEGKEVTPVNYSARIYTTVPLFEFFVRGETRVSGFSFGSMAGFRNSFPFVGISISPDYRF